MGISLSIKASLLQILRLKSADTDRVQKDGFRILASDLLRTRCRSDSTFDKFPKRVSDRARETEKEVVVNGYLLRLTAVVTLHEVKRPRPISRTTRK
jgi:hypothetical protein